MFFSSDFFSKSPLKKRVYKNISVKPKSNLTLWYLNESENDHKGWECEALPIGNGDMGCKIFGGIAKERIQFNEKSLWTGDTVGVNGCDNGNANGDFGKSMKEIQKLLADGDYGAAEKNMHRLQGDEIGLGAYQNFGDAYFDFKTINADSASSYVRSLDLETAVSKVEFTYGGAAYTREYFASHPDHVCVFRFTGKDLAVRVSLVSAQTGGRVTAQADTLMLTGSIGTDPLKYCAAFRIITDGSLHASADALDVEKANEITVYACFKTNYGFDYPRYRDDLIDPEEYTKRTIDAAVKKGFDRVRKNHIEDYQALFSGVRLDIGQETPDIPTDMLLYKYFRGTPSKALEHLFFQYGRYLLISSSRADGLPANLQGVWNDSNTPAWQSDYHLNINLQMNYFPALVGNMNETVLPLIRFVNKCLMIPGRASAYKWFNIGDGDTAKPTGWVASTQNNIFGHTGFGSDWRWGWAPTAGAFILENTFEYYLFTKDIELLEKEIYPAMQEHALLWSQLLIEDKKTGRLVSSPGFSPEHGPVSLGNTFDQQMVWELYNNVLRASADLIAAGKENAVNGALIETLQKQIVRLQPNHIGNWGQVKEWIEEDNWKKRGVRTHNVALHHRHTSHLMGLYPGTMFSPEEKELFEAARVSLNDRGDRGQGWSKALKICEWARLLDGDRAHRLLSEQLKYNTLYNLWDIHPPFQIDGNFGASAGICEMLLQSHTGVVHVLPALPSCWNTGSFSGLMARGNFEISCSWENSAVKELRILSKSGGTCKLRVNGKELTVETRRGQTYEVEV